MLLGITHLDITNNSLASLDGIQNFSNLKLLLASVNNISDLTGLDKLIKLDTLCLGSNKISSLNQVKNISTLKTLYLGGNSSLNNLDETVINKELNYLYAKNIGTLDFSTEFWTNNNGENKIKLGKIENLYIDSSYSLIFSNTWKMQIDANVTDLEFKQLKNNSYISSLMISR